MMYPVRAAGVLVLLGLACCASRQKQLDTAERGLATAVSATKATRAAFAQWNADHELVLVRTAASREDAEAKVAAYRQARAPVFAALTAAWASLSAASSALALAAADDADLKTAIDLTAKALRAVIAVRAAIAALQGGPT